MFRNPFSSSSPASKSTRNSVLFVGNDGSDLALRKQLLESSGFSVVTAPSSEDGLNLFMSKPVDAVVVDSSLPGERANELTAAIKRHNPRTPLIILAEHATVTEKVRALVDAIVLKAQEPELLLNRVTSLVKIRSHSHPQLDHKYVVFIDSSRRYLDCSNGVCQLLGFERMELLGMTVDDVSYRPQKTNALFQQYVDNGKLQGQYILKHKSGRPVFIHYRSEIFPDGCMAAVWEPVEDWMQLYQSAMLELDPKELRDRVVVAQSAIQERIHALADGKAREPQEWQQLQDALSGLRVLSRELEK